MLKEEEGPIVLKTKRTRRIFACQQRGIVKVIDGLRKEKKTLYQLHFCKQNVKRALGVCIALDFVYSSYILLFIWLLLRHIIWGEVYRGSGAPFSF